MKSKLFCLIGLACMVQVSLSQKVHTVYGQEILQSNKYLEKKFTTYSLYSLEVDKLSKKLSNEEIVLSLKLGSQETISVKLHPATISSDDVIRISGISGVETIPPTSYYLYIGTDNRTALTISGNYISGVLQDQDEVIWYIEPLVVFDSEADLSTYVVYKEVDIVDQPSPVLCLHESMEREENKIIQKSRGDIDEPFCREVELAIGIDHTFSAAYPGTYPLPHSILRVLTYFSILHQRYQGINEFDLHFTISEWFVSDCSNCTPWQVDSMAVIYINHFSNWAHSLDGFTSFYDVACVWTHKRIYGYNIDAQQIWGIGGAAGGTPCVRTAALITDTLVTNLDRLGSRFAHEVGHTLGYVHDASGTNWIMSPSVTDSTVAFSPASVQYYQETLPHRNCLNSCDEISVCDEHEEPDNAPEICSIHWEWVKSAGWMYEDQANDIAIDQEENIYTTGYYTHLSFFDNEYLFPCDNHYFDKNMFLSSYSSSGDLRWLTNECSNQMPNEDYGGENPTEGLSLATDCDNNVFMAGYRINGPTYNKELYLEQFSQSGDHQFEVHDFQIREQSISSVEVNSQDRVVFGGSFKKSLSLGNMIYEGNESDLDGYLILGNRFGHTDYASTTIRIGDIQYNDEEVYDIEVDDNDNIYITGYYTDQTRFLDSHGNVLSLLTFGDKDVFVAKCTPSGKLEWVQSLSGIGEDLGYALDTDHEGNLYVVGSFSSVLQSDNAVHVVHSTGEEDIFLAKYDSDGNMLWLKRGGGIGKDVGYDIACHAGKVFVSGAFEYTSNYDDSTTLFSSHGKQDLFVLVSDKEGNAIQVETAGGLGDDVATGITISKDQSIYITGSFEETMSFGNHQLSSAGDKDIFVAKLYTNISVDVQAYHATCSESDGSISITITQGDGPYIIHWESMSNAGILGNDVLSGNASYQISNLPAGVYRIAIQGGKQCMYEERIVEVKDDCCMDARFSYYNANSFLPCTNVYFTDESSTTIGNPSYWEWNFGDGSISNTQNPVHVYNSSGTYTVCLTTCERSCCDVYCNEVVVEDCDKSPSDQHDAHNKHSLDTKYSIYPNPAQSHLYINSEGGAIKRIKLYDPLGKEILEQEVNHTHSTIDITNLQQGIYVMSLYMDNQQVRSHRFVKR